ncbi:Carboxylesterase NlhH [Anatilimnocola aggregata]|uniref:Carboxylesterase NlhH n=1 Tax=Anatilimnocola aggregata TaxID=2528021 RepID=A0A517YB76_9BACT|nr:alpha/beta hydrolase [Anatilimnocola aggregata]QDU27513.1 Carboxylesterase NlhH [Anatilimnocola aggregata]
MLQLQMPCWISVWLALWTAAATQVVAQAPPRLPTEIEVVRDIEFGQGGGRALKLHLVRPKELPTEPMPAIVYIHGGGWTGGNRDGGLGHASQWARRGILGASIEYRLSGEAKFPAQIEDCKCAIRFLRAKAKEYHLDPDRIAVCGHSAGGHLSALVGTSAHLPELEGKGGWPEFSSKVRAVCAISGPADFPTWGNEAHPAVRGLLGGLVTEKPELAALASPVTHVQKSTPPFLIIHGDKDDIVPVSQGRAMHAALEKVGADSTLLVVEGGNHHPYSPETGKAMNEFFEKHLRSKAEKK